MDIDKMIEQWEEKHSSILIEYSKGNVNNEVMSIYRSQMKNILDFINQLKQVKKCFIIDVSGQSEQFVCGRDIKTCVFYENNKCKNNDYCRDQVEQTNCP